MAYILGFNDAVVAAANLYLTGGGGGSGAAIPGTVVVGDLLAADTTSSFARIAAPAVGQVLKSNGVGVAPSWSASPSLTSLTLGGATLSTNALAVAGTGQITGKVYVGSAAPTSSNYALWKDGSNRLWVNADATNGTVSVGVADDYGVTYTGPAYAGGRGWRLNSDVTFGWSATNPLAALDTGLSRISAGVIGVGTGAQGSVAGGLQAATLALGGNGALSAPVLSGTGTWITGGTATTTKPYALIEPAGTTSTAWSTNGTGLGVNAATGFTGNLIDAQLNGVLKFRVASTGNMRLGGTTYDWVFDGNTSPAQMTISANGVGVGGAINDQGFKALSYQMSSSLAAAVDANISRVSAGIVGVGTGTQGSTAGSLSLLTMVMTGNLQMQNNNSSVYMGAAYDLIFGRGGPATFQHGYADTASPVAQTIKFQDVVAGTSNTAGVNATIQAPAGTGTGAGGSLIFQVAPAGSSGSAKNAWATAWLINSSGHLLAGTDGTYDIGTSGASRPRNVYATTTIQAGNGVITNGALNGFSFQSRGYILAPADGVFKLSNIADNDFSRLQFGGTTSSFPALKRSTTSLQARLADDSAFTAIQGKLTTDTAYTAGDPTTTGYLVVYDSTGTAYRVPALLN